MGLEKEELVPMTEDAPKKQRKRSPAFIVVPILMLILAAVFVLLNSNLVLSKTTVLFSVDKEKQLNKMVIVAPFGAYIQTFSIVPGSSKEKAYAVGSSAGGGRPVSLFGQSNTWSNSIPGSGRITDIDSGSPVKITNRMPMAAVASIPKDKAVLANCGTYIWVTKKPKGEADFQAFVDRLNTEYKESQKSK